MGEGVTAAKNRTRYLFAVPMIGMALLLSFHETCREGVGNGLRLCGEILIPSLFPFSVLTSMTVRTGFPACAERRFGKAARKLFSLPGSAAAPLALGLLGGYPLGVHCLCELYRAGRLTKQQAARLSGFCNNPGPAFLVGAVGAVCLGSAFYGLLLFGITVLSALLTGMLFAPKVGNVLIVKKSTAASESILTAFPKALLEGTRTMLHVSGIVVFFSAFQAILARLLGTLRLPDWFSCLTAGCLELTTGIAAAQTLSALRRFLLCAFLVNWGGLCVHMQAAALLAEADLPIRTYLSGKVVQSLFSVLLAGIPALLLFQTAPRFRIAGLLAAGLTLFFLLFFAFFQKGHWKTGKSVLY